METLVQTQVVSHLTIVKGLKVVSHLTIVKRLKLKTLFFFQPHRILPGEANTALLEVGEPMFDGQVNIIQAHLVDKV